MSRSLIITNFILFQAGWLACVAGGAHQMGVAGSLFALLVAALHLWRAADRVAELSLLAIALLIGFCLESAMVLSGLAVFSDGMLFGQLAPHWMLMMWVLFATTLNVSMSWVKSLHPGWVALLGGVLAPLSYLAGSRLGAVVFPEPLVSLTVIGLSWAVLFPLLVRAAKHFNGYGDVSGGDRTSWRSVNV
ncbi:MAG: DUF2878 domain-containing protein [Thiolinea sp.]